MDIACPSCGKNISIPEPIGRRDTCPLCTADLHTCRNCIHFDPGSYNDCREPQADRVVEKASSNFCDYFSIRRDGKGSGVNPKDKAKAALDSLFKK